MGQLLYQKQKTNSTSALLSLMKWVHGREGSTLRIARAILKRYSFPSSRYTSHSLTTIREVNTLVPEETEGQYWIPISSGKL